LLKVVAVDGGSSATVVVAALVAALVATGVAVLVAAMGLAASALLSLEEAAGAATARLS
jgi:hypothetical protein